MLKKRIIPCLDIQNGRTVKGVNFIDIKDAGDPVILAKRYVAQGADELVFLDITATIENRKALIHLVERVGATIDIPFTVGGGISSLDDVSALLKAGADKISVNSAAIENPKLISEIAKEFGSQCVVVAIDTKYVDAKWRVFKHGGRTLTSLTSLDWAKQVEVLGAGEILLTSMNNDGTKKGFALDITQTISDAVNMPIIASGGAGCLSDFQHVFQKTKATGALAASIFHYGDIFIPELKTFLNNQKIAVRLI